MVKPNVLCVGFAKCGTTTLYDIMSKHKDIFLSGIKEPSYYNHKQLYSNGFEWYQKRYYPKKVKEKIIMEVNPKLIKHIDPKIIKKDYGKNLKIIFLIRSPIERTYSHFKMKLLSGGNFDKLEDSLSASTSNLFNKWLNMYYDKKTKKFKECGNTSWTKNSNYYENIKKYMDVFGKDNIKVIIFEDFIKNPKQTCNEIYKFIGIEEDETIEYDIHSNEGNRLPKNKLSIKINRWYYFKIYNRIILRKFPYISNGFCKIVSESSWTITKLCSKKDKFPEKMLPENKETLRKHYYNEIKKLSQLLNVDLLKKWKME